MSSVTRWVGIGNLSQKPEVLSILSAIICIRWHKKKYLKKTHVIVMPIHSSLAQHLKSNQTDYFSENFLLLFLTWSYKRPTILRVNLLSEKILPAIR